MINLENRLGTLILEKGWILMPVNTHPGKFQMINSFGKISGMSIQEVIKLAEKFKS